VTGGRPRLIDEWQDAPAIWDAVRLEADREPEAGQFILAGSATPRDGATAHTGTGRFSRLRLWPFSSVESGLSTGTVSIGGLLRNEPMPVAPGQVSGERLIKAILAGGWPSSLNRSEQEAAEVAQHYLDGLISSDASRLDGTRRDPDKLRALIALLAGTKRPQSLTRP
jgi:predicted AAA+ superfamily ATPase